MTRRPRRILTVREPLRRISQALRRALIISFVQQKGGAGKSTAAFHLAVEAAAQGVRTLVIDADRQRTVRGWARRGGRVDNLSVLSMNQELLDKAPPLATQHDLVIVDTAGQLNDFTDATSSVRAALMVADQVVLPCGPSPADASALYGDQPDPDEEPSLSTADLIQRARQVRPGLDACVLLTRRLPRQTGLRAELEGPDRLPVLRAELRYLIPYQTATLYGQGVTVRAPGGPEAREIRRLLRELVQRAGACR